MVLLLVAVTVPPVTFQEYVLPETNGVMYVTVSISQTVSGPAITGAGKVRIVAFTVTVESHPRLLISVTEMLAVPAVVQNTSTDVPLEGPVIVPPFTIHV